MSPGTRNSNVFIFSLDAVVFYKNLCLDNRIYFRALNSYIKTRMSWEKTNAIFEFLVTKSFEKKFLSQISCTYFRVSKFQFSYKFQNRKYASVELENHFQSVKSWFSVVLNIGATISLRDEMIWRKIPFNSPPST